MSKAKPAEQEIRVNPVRGRQWAVQEANDAALEQMRGRIADLPIYELEVPYLQDGDSLSVSVSVPFVVALGGKELDTDVMPIGFFILLGKNPNRAKP